MKRIYSKIKTGMLFAALILASVFGLLIVQDKIIKVSALVEPIAFMGPNADFGIVFPGEFSDKEFFVQAEAEYNASVSYSLITQVKPRRIEDSEYCLANSLDYSKCYPLLCPYLSIVSEDYESDIKNNALLDPPGGDIIDNWKVILDTPPIIGSANQNFEGVPVDSAGEYGCDIKLSLIDNSLPDGDVPAVNAIWEMNAAKDGLEKYLANDDLDLAGAQFLPSGRYRVDTEIAACAVVSDIQGLNKINKVYAEIHYPATVDLGQGHESAKKGCGEVQSEIVLEKLPKMDGINLFCDKIRNNNSNLPLFGANSSYDIICGLNSGLSGENMAVYCGEINLLYGDPSSEYRTLIMAEDTGGLSGTLENYFDYLELAAFETDFNNIDYGKVKSNTHKTIKGDDSFEVDGKKATVRNTGNVRLNILVLQDDTELGKSGEKWNVRYDARVGDKSNFTDYFPQENAILSNQINLTETKNMDFSIFVEKFSNKDKDSFSGTMVLSIVKAPHLVCQ